MRNYRDHLISRSSEIKEALIRFNQLSKDAILFVIDEEDKLVGSLTDGDVRRGLIKGLSAADKIELFIQPNPKYIRKSDYSLEQIMKLRDGDFKIIPVLANDHSVINVINFRFLKSYLPVDCVIMAGGRGSRLQPLTDTVPKPLLPVGSKPIMEHNVDRLCQFGIDDFWFSVRYLGEQIESYFEDGSAKDVEINYIWETKPLGTIGAVNQVKNFKHDYILITNSDLLTTLDYEAFFLDFINQNADMAVASIPYSVDVPYAVMETKNNHVLSFAEKPTYTYYSNGGIYLVKREILDMIPDDTFFNSTDLMQKVIDKGMTLISHPIRGYWLDVGKPEDYKKAQMDINHLGL